ARSLIAPAPGARGRSTPPLRADAHALRHSRRLRLSGEVPGVARPEARACRFRRAGPRGRAGGGGRRPDAVLARISHRSSAATNPGKKSGLAALEATRYDPVPAAFVPKTNVP